MNLRVLKSMLPSYGGSKTPTPFSLSIQNPLNHLPLVAKSPWVSLAQSPSLEFSLDIPLPRGLYHPLSKRRTKLLAHLIFPRAAQPRPA